jgi:hypothetical protein
MELRRKKACHVTHLMVALNPIVIMHAIASVLTLHTICRPSSSSLGSHC